MLLVLMTFLPLVGIPLLWLTNSVKGQRTIAAVTSAVVMVLSLVLYAGFEPGVTDFGSSFARTSVGAGRSSRWRLATVATSPSPIGRVPVRRW